MKGGMICSLGCHLHLTSSEGASLVDRGAKSKCFNLCSMPPLVCDLALAYNHSDLPLPCMFSTLSPPWVGVAVFKAPRLLPRSPTSSFFPSATFTSLHFANCLGGIWIVVSSLDFGVLQAGTVITAAQLLLGVWTLVK